MNAFETYILFIAKNNVKPTPKSAELAITQQAKMKLAPHNCQILLWGSVIIFLVRPNSSWIVIMPN
jgi:hypothetical protein